MVNIQPQYSDIIFYTSPEGNVNVEVLFNDETFWLNQKRMAELFGVDVRTINGHPQNIFKTTELQKDATIRKNRMVQKMCNQEVSTIRKYRIVENKGGIITNLSVSA